MVGNKLLKGIGANTMEKKWQNKEWLEEKYSKYGSTTIARECGIDDSTIIYWLKKFKIPTRSRSESLRITQNRIHNVDVDYFSEINTPQKAYWLGFIVADGSIRNPSKDVYYADFELSVKDEETVRQFANDIKYGEILIDHYRARCNVNNTVFTKNLMNHGVCTNKTGREVFPKIDKKLVRYFILGYFDGDGSIMYYERETKVRSRFHIVCANRNFLEKIKSILENEANVAFTKSSLHKKYVGSDVYELETATLPNIAKINDYFYTDCECYHLQRKEEKFKKLISHYITMPRLIKRYSPNCLEIGRVKQK